MEILSEALRFLLEYHLFEAIPFALLFLYLSVMQWRGRDRKHATQSNRTTSRSSEYYSTEIDEL